MCRKLRAEISENRKLRYNWPLLVHFDVASMNHTTYFADLFKISDRNYDQTFALNRNRNFCLNSQKNSVRLLTYLMFNNT